MSDLGTALELMYQAAYMPLSTLRMTVAETSDEAALWRSLYAQATDHGPDYLTIGSASFHGGIPPLPKEDSSASEHVWRMCIENSGPPSSRKW